MAPGKALSVNRNKHLSSDQIVAWATHARVAQDFVRWSYKNEIENLSSLDLDQQILTISAKL